MVRIFKFTVLQSEVDKECPICRERLEYLFPDGEMIYDPDADSKCVRTDEILIHAAERVVFSGKKY